MRRIRKGDLVKLKPGTFLMQSPGETATVLYVYRGKAHLNTTGLNCFTSIPTEDLERVPRRPKRV